ncbi:MAG: peptidoglycan-associated lipoprotein Pal [Deltaproteobacteria bacterium]|nr:peptidoglycan-associated lipoprotein Pal [Deltaproteobacteria bacterium]
MKAKQIGFWALILLFFISGLFLFSCSKKEVKSEGIVSKPPAAVEDEAEKAKKRVRIKEQELAEQELRAKALREEEAKRLKAASEKAHFESEDIYFEFDQSILSDTAKQNLNKKAQWLKDFPAAKALIEGHCDERGSAEYNLALGQKRADAAMNYLTSLGINANRISTISYGKEKPLDTGSNEAAWAKNRRVHFVLK